MKTIDFEIGRKLTLQISGKQSEAVLIIGGLGQKAPGSPWACRCRISGILPNEKLIYGEDEIHALTNCLLFCAATLKDFNNAEQKVWWLEPGDQGGIFGPPETGEPSAGPIP